MFKEVWKDVKGYEGKYQVSNLGRVKSLNYHRSGKERLLSLAHDKDGYLYVCFHKNGKQKLYKVHRLVAIAFIPNPDNLPCVNHKDENPSNNRVENLEWCTQKYNINYGTRTKRMSKAQSKPVICITTKRIFKSFVEASKYYKVDKGNICHCCKGEQKSAGKYKGQKLVWKHLNYNHNKTYRVVGTLKLAV